MNLERLDYSKSDGTLDQNRPEHTIDKQHKDAEVVSSPPLQFVDGYSKEQPSLETTVVFILSGGSKRERDYFHPIFREPSLKRIKVAFRSKEGQGLKPYELKQMAENFLSSHIFVNEDGTGFDIEEGDRLYLLQDVDEFADTILPYLNVRQDAPQIKWIISNPSFEVWLYYHYFDSPVYLQPGLELNERDRSNWLKEHLDKIIRGGVQSTKALFQVKTAIANSLKCYSENDGMPDVFCTQMHEVAQSVVDAMGSELDDLITKRRERIAKFIAGIDTAPK